MMVKIRFPILSKEEYIKLGEDYNFQDLFKTPQDSLKFSIKCKQKDILRQELEIEKSKERIKRLKKAINNAQEATKHFSKALPPTLPP